MYEFKDPFIIDFSNLKTHWDIHRIIKEALDFPDYYGCNWDAFWDCLTDMVGRPTHIEIVGLDVIERRFPGDEKKMIEILKRFKHYNNDKYSHEITIEIVNGDNRVALS